MEAADPKECPTTALLDQAQREIDKAEIERKAVLRDLEMASEADTCVRLLAARQAAVGLTHLITRLAHAEALEAAARSFRGRS